MIYTIRRISLGSALRVGLALGWLIALFPSLVLAWLALVALRQVNTALSQVTPYELNLLGQTVARFDLFAALGLTGLVQAVARLAGNGPVTFLTIAAVLTVAGAAIILVTVLMFCLCYNALAAIFGGLKLELRQDER
jgi:hypothetical protein